MKKYEDVWPQSIPIECTQDELEKIDTYIHEVMGFEWDDEEETWCKYDFERGVWIR
jgi:hypothetical protein